MYILLTRINYLFLHKQIVSNKQKNCMFSSVSIQESLFCDLIFICCCFWGRISHGPIAVGSLACLSIASAFHMDGYRESWHICGQKCSRICRRKSSRQETALMTGLPPVGSPYFSLSLQSRSLFATSLAFLVSLRSSMPTTWPLSTTILPLTMVYFAIWLSPQKTSAASGSLWAPA